MKAIQTKIIPASNTKPTRIKVMAEGVAHKIWSRDSIENELLDRGLPVRAETIHHYAAAKFALLNEWPTKLVSGGLPNGDWCHCFTDQTWIEYQAKPKAREFTVVSVSSNANNFGYKGVLVLAEDGTGFELQFQAYGCDPLPKRGDVLKSLPSYPLPRPLAKCANAPAILAEVHKSLNK